MPRYRRRLLRPLVYPTGAAVIRRPSWGARDDATYVEVTGYTVGEPRKRGVGSPCTPCATGWSPTCTRRVRTGRSPDCLHFIEADGRLRAGHQAHNQSRLSTLRA